MNTVVSSIPPTDEAGLGGVQLVTRRPTVGVSLCDFDCVLPDN
jgi:hypothetical protein